MKKTYPAADTAALLTTLAKLQAQHPMESEAISQIRQRLIYQAGPEAQDALAAKAQTALTVMSIVAAAVFAVLGIAVAYFYILEIASGAISFLSHCLHIGLIVFLLTLSLLFANETSTTGEGE